MQGHGHRGIDVRSWGASKMRKLLFTCKASAEEAVLLTAAIRDLHRCYPGEFQTSVDTNFPAFWQNNPYGSQLKYIDETTEVIQCKLPALADRNTLAHHAIHSFIDLFNDRLGLQVRMTACAGDIRLSGDEKSWASQVAEIVGEEIPYWIVVARGDRAQPLKNWGRAKFQRVIDHFGGKIQFVQIGDVGHPRLEGVVDFRGQTDLRQLIRLMYHSQGVVCPPSVHMHLAAAVEDKLGNVGRRQCVVIAGGLESVHWSGYPQHQYIHRIGMLPCCLRGGCWKSRLIPRADGRDDFCVDVVRKTARCMMTIPASEVVQKIEACARAEQLPMLSSEQVHAADLALSLGNKMKWVSRRMEAEVFRQACEKFVPTIPPCPELFHGRGIVICAGGQYLPGAWVCIRMLRKLGCNLPVEIWHLGKEELPEEFEQLVQPFLVRAVDGLKMMEESRARQPCRELRGWLLKAFAIKHSRFEEVLLLDADNVPTVSPEFLFDSPSYARTGALFWPDIRPGLTPAVWKIFGTPYVEESEFESGQIVVHKRKCWRALCLALWYNEHGDFYYQHVHGDKDTFHFAFRKVGKPFSLIKHAVQLLPGTLCQHDFRGRRIFQHRNGLKWRLTQDNPQVPGFLYEQECRLFLDELRRKWLTPPSGCIVPDRSKKTAQAERYSAQLIQHTHEFQREGYEARRVSFNSDGSIGFGCAQFVRRWQVTDLNGMAWLELLSDQGVTCRLTPDTQGNWYGRWNYDDRGPVRLTPEWFHRHRSSSAPASLSSSRNCIYFRAPLNSYSGYGLLANQIVTDLQEMGCDFLIRAFDINETFAPIPHDVRKSIACHEHPSEWELILHPPGVCPQAGKRTVYFTMSESTKVPSHAVQSFNACECLIVPTSWNASCFLGSGVEKPIYVVPLGVNSDVFRHVPMTMEGPCIFGTAGRLESGGSRKGIDLVIDVFKKAFSANEDVRLHVKVFPDCDVAAETDPRVEIRREFLSDEQLAAWLAGLTCFVSASRGEGWGLIQHQALATGRPMIGIRFGGTAEFFTPRMGYPLEFRLEPAEGVYEDCGQWAEPDERHLLQRMREVYQDREHARCLGLNATQSVSRLTWSESSRKLRQVLQQVGMID